MKTFKAPLLLFITPMATAEMIRTPSPPDAAVYIVAPADGDTVSRTFAVTLGLKGMGVAPTVTEKEKTGHHHLLIDGKMLLAMDLPLGKEIKHFGGQTQAELILSPGKHTLQLILGDRGPVPHDPPVVSDVVTVTVK